MSGVEAVAETSKKAGRVKCVVAAGVLAPVAVVACVYVSVIAPHNRAVKAFEVAAAQVQEKNSALQAEIDAAQQSLDKGCKPLDVATQDALTVAVADAGLALRAVPKISWCRVWGRCRGCQILSLSPKAMTPTGN